MKIRPVEDGLEDRGDRDVDLDADSTTVSANSSIFRNKFDGTSVHDMFGQPLSVRKRSSLKKQIINLVIIRMEDVDEWPRILKEFFPKFPHVLPHYNAFAENPLVNTKQEYFKRYSS